MRTVYGGGYSKLVQTIQTVDEAGETDRRVAVSRTLWYGLEPLEQTKIVGAAKVHGCFIVMPWREE
jgi:hypothetical protein